MIKRLLQVKVSLTGENSSLVISRLQKDRVTLKNVSGREKITFMIRYADLFALRKAVRRTGSKVSLSSEETIHRVYRFTKLNIPSLAALLLAVIIFLQAFQYIWSVDITGVTPELREEAEELLIEKGIKPGVRYIAFTLDQQSASINNQIRQTSEHPISLFGFTLPFMLVEHKYKEVSQSDVNFSKEQSVTLPKEIAVQDVLSFTDGGGQVHKEKILHEDIENGKVKLTIFYEVLENIAATKPFTEETRE
ncbi:hypothetical protein JMA_21850 [Jeotgalibacillus malaysiensis]|uniref:Stage IV sporulation protein n=1 Tax=Jeotgalibacillus malaysiensis TaxID=1508404 RepID=A0A0B5AS22_9BACL|nr:sporulation protein YqfD [Jeotgalibacillus malaysiensis]AJD91502.1 hypothetical protein JMA_21850 [Jeotgalibacillus malaysiensis]